MYIILYKITKYYLKIIVIKNYRLFITNIILQEKYTKISWKTFTGTALEYMNAFNQMLLAALKKVIQNKHLTYREYKVIQILSRHELLLKNLDRFHFEGNANIEYFYNFRIRLLFSHSVVFYSLQPHDFPVLHHILKLAQIYVHWVHDAIQPSHPLLSPSPPAFSLSQHQGLFQRVGSLHQVAKVLGLQPQFFQRIFRTDFL